MNFILFISFLFLLYTFIGYPLLLQTIKKQQPAPLKDDETLPKVTVILCIYNSSLILAKRLTNILESDYPGEKLKILVVSDGSTDQPQEVINSLADSRISLLHYEKNQGKSFALSQALPNVKTDYVAFADVRQRFDHLALRHLASNLVDDNIGAISGNLKIQSSDESEEQGLYWRYEKSIRMKESDLHSLLGVTGAIYMAKTKLIPQVPVNSLLDDMYIPLCIVKQGYKVKFCEEAIAYDSASSSTHEEFTRKVRTLAGNYQLIKQLPWLLSIKSNPLFFQFFSHKVARLIMPFALIGLLLSSALIDNAAINTLFWLQVIFYCYSFLGYRFKAYRLPLISTCISFCSLNLAALVAAWKYFTVKDITSLWKQH